MRLRLAGVCKSSVRCGRVGGRRGGVVRAEITTGTLVWLSTSAPAERKSRERRGWRDRVRFSQQLRCATVTRSRMSTLRRSWRRGEEFAVVCREARKDSGGAERWTVLQVQFSVSQPSL